MLTEKEAHDLMAQFIDLRKKYEETNDPKIGIELQKHQAQCMKQFKYLITMRTGRYKSFSNYDDLNQDGFEALVKAMKTFKLGKGSFFSWAHHYIATSISRRANLHTTIRYPLKIAKEITPHKESIMPVQIEQYNCPDKKLEELELTTVIQETLSSLSDQQKNIIKLLYGLNGDKPASINKICKTLCISRSDCIKAAKISLLIMRDNIKL